MSPVGKSLLSGACWESVLLLLTDAFTWLQAQRCAMSASQEIPWGLKLRPAAWVSHIQQALGAGVRALLLCDCRKMGSEMTKVVVVPALWQSLRMAQTWKPWSPLMGWFHNAQHRKEGWYFLKSSIKIRSPINWAWGAQGIASPKSSQPDSSQKGFKMAWK